MINQNIIMLCMSLLFFDFVVSGEQRINPQGTDPVFTISTFPGTYSDSASGTMPGISFMATPDQDVYLIKITIQSPVTQPIDIPMENKLFLSNKAIKLGLFPRVGGKWIFIFTGRKPTGEQKEFVVTVEHEVNN